jgi:hypothetical protein
MIAGDDHHLSAGAQGRADLFQRLGRRRQRVAQRPVPELQQVTQQDEAIAVGERAQQRWAGLGDPENVGDAPRPEVQIRDDQRSQRSAPGTRAPRGRTVGLVS